jgi:hypothetical protein
MKRAMKQPKKPPYKVQVLDRALNILEFIGKQGNGETGLPELSVAIKLHKTTTHRIAQVLESRGLLRRGPESNRYRLASIYMILAVTLLIWKGALLRRVANLDAHGTPSHPFRHILRALRDYKRNACSVFADC